MHIESIKQMMECLATKANAELSGNIENVDTEEMGEIIDMIKDLAEAKYYCSITEEMEESKDNEETLLKMGLQPDTSRYYGGRRYYYDPVIHSEYPRYYNDRRCMSRYYNGGGNYGSGGRYYNDNRYENGRYAPDGDTMRRYSTDYPDIYDPANSFNRNKWRLDKNNSLESKYDRAMRYYSESKAEHDKGTEEDNNAKLKFLGEFLDTASDDIVDIYNDASSTEQDMITKKMSTLLAKMK